MASQGVLDLLVPGDGSSSDYETFLAAEILHSRETLNSEAQRLVGVVSERAEESEGELSLLVEGVAACSPETILRHFAPWTLVCIRVMQETTTPTTFHLALHGLSLLLRGVSGGRGEDTIGSQQLSPVLLSLLSFSEAPPTLQAPVMRLLAPCLVNFHSSCSQQKIAIKKWASAAAVNPYQPLAQEASRVLVLLCHHSNQQWSMLVDCVLGGLEWILRQLRHHDTTSTTAKGKDGFGDLLSGWFTVAPPPPALSERMAYLLFLLSHLTRTLCHALLFPPLSADPAPPPSVPVERILTVLMQGLKPLPTGHTLEARVLQDATPILHTAMWNCLSVLISTCHAHLLLYNDDVVSLLNTALSSKTMHQSPQLLAAVYRTLSAWVKVARDCDASRLTPLLRGLLQSCDSTPLCPSSLQTMAGVVSALGPLLTTPLASRISELPLRTLTPALPAGEALPLVQLLGACLQSGNQQLCPPRSAAVQLLSQLANSHPAQQVVELCRSSLSSLSSPSYPPTTSRPPTISDAPSTSRPPARSDAPSTSCPPSTLDAPSASNASSITGTSDVPSPHPLPPPTSRYFPPTSSGNVNRKRSRESSEGEGEVRKAVRSEVIVQETVALLREMGRGGSRPETVGGQCSVTLEDTVEQVDTGDTVERIDIVEVDTGDMVEHIDTGDMVEHVAASDTVEQVVASEMVERVDVVDIDTGDMGEAMREGPGPSSVNHTSPQSGGEESVLVLTGESEDSDSEASGMEYFIADSPSPSSD